jgi:ankyrin repeat protein
MKHLLLTTIAAVVLVGCGPSVDIHQAAREGNIEAVKQAIADGGDVNVKDKRRWIDFRSGFRLRRNGETPLHDAATKEVAELLISKGADVNAKNNDGVTPLHYAARYGRKEVAELLIAKGAEVNAKSDTTGRLFSQEQTPLHYAANGGQKEIVELLIAAGADVNAKGRGFFQTPLQFAANKGHKEIAELLVAGGADVNTKTDNPLHLAALWGEKEIVELLIAAGADVNAKRADGRTPLDMAKRKPETAELLRKHGGKTGEELKAEGK